MFTCAVPLVSVEVEATVTPAAEASDGVPALSVSTEVMDHLTLVYICREKERRSVTYAGGSWTHPLISVRIIMT